MIEEKEGFHQLFQSEPLQQGIHGPLISLPRSLSSFWSTTVWTTFRPGTRNPDFSKDQAK